MIGETERRIDVGASSEGDAHDLAAELSGLSAVGDADASRLGWFRRWRIRQQLLGNYAEMRDPTQPL